VRRKVGSPKTKAEASPALTPALSQGEREGEGPPEPDPFVEEAFAPALREAAAKLEPGKVGEVFESPQGVHLVLRRSGEKG
jgi:parvulin-like peptidyl-prolyl isomerase